ncbi:MAG: DoxX family protein [Bacteroidetes bacterium]|nr:DoxX family protein [Bacteroidota bacterium]
MNTALWIVQGLLSAMFVMAGLMKATLPKEKLSKMSWTARHSASKIKFIGFSELLIALGLILPGLTGILPILTTVAALALSLVMVLAAFDHFKNKEMKELGVNLFVIVLALFVSYGRF